MLRLEVYLFLTIKMLFSLEEESNRMLLLVTERRSFQADAIGMSLSLSSALKRTKLKE